jgi:hypothetical protein
VIGSTPTGFPIMGPIRVAFLLAIVATPFRFRGKRQPWPYAGLAVVTRTSSENEIVDGKLRRRKRAPLTRGLNRNHNRVLKNRSTFSKRPRRRFGGEAQSEKSVQQSVTLRHSPNHSPLRMTRRSVRPADKA